MLFCDMVERSMISFSLFLPLLVMKKTNVPVASADQEETMKVKEGCVSK